MPENIDRFIAEFKQSLAAQTFVKLTLGNYKGEEKELQKVQIRLVTTKKGLRLFFLFRYSTRDTAKNYDFEEGAGRVAEALATGFRSAHLFTTTRDFQLEVGNKGRSRLNFAKPSFKTAPSPEHDREKRRFINPDAYYLKALGITSEAGQIRDKQQDKWRQINRFVEILAGLIDKSELKNRTELSIVDMGSGKGYLTFGAYDYLTTTRGLKVSVTGVEIRQNLVDAGNEIATGGGLDGLRFVRGTITEYDVGRPDILIALHACDTATDDAIHKGIAAGSEIIIVAPCCQHELRRQIKPPEMLKGVFEHGVMFGRVVEFVTDSLRTLLIERSGYSTTLLDFVPIEHTPKNLMIVGTRNPADNNTADIGSQIDQIKAFYGIEHQRLDDLLGRQNE